MKLLTFLLLLVLPLNLFAQVYTWTDKNGKVHYSSKKQDPQAKIAELPGLTKGEVPVPTEASVTCFNHGGIDCLIGADEDGSVICKDGEKNSMERFLFSCKEAKISLENIGEISPEGNFPVYIRNKSGVKAKKVVVGYQAAADHLAYLAGPAEIAPFELAEYQLPGIYFIDGRSKPDKKAVKVSCSNCP